MEGFSQSRQHLGGEETLVVNVHYKVLNNVVWVRGAKGWEKTTIPIEIYRTQAPQEPTKEQKEDK